MERSCQSWCQVITYGYSANLFDIRAMGTVNARLQGTSDYLGGVRLPVSARVTERHTKRGIDIFLHLKLESVVPESPRWTYVIDMPPSPTNQIYSDIEYISTDELSARG